MSVVEDQKAKAANLAAFMRISARKMVGLALEEELSAFLLSAGLREIFSKAVILLEVSEKLEKAIKETE